MDAEANSCDKATSYNKETKTFTTNFHEKMLTCETQNFYILLELLLITIN